MEKKIDLNQIIDNMEKEINEILDFNFKTRKQLEDPTASADINLYYDIIKKIEKYPVNGILINLLGDYLQLTNVEFLLDHYEFDEIQKLIELNILSSRKMNIQFFDDIIYFNWNVMDDAENSIKFINEVIEIFEPKVKEYKKLKKEIEEEQRLPKLNSKSD